MSDFIVLLQVLAAGILLCVVAVIALIIAVWILATLYALVKNPLNYVFDMWREWYRKRTE